jgi:translation initiation factor 2 alpha subunit (eIF-2alpha)
MIKEDDVVLCSVKKIESAIVFVETSDGSHGSIAMSEIAAGRIRNLREYVSLNKKIVCKALKIGKDNIELSLRRVTAKEHDEVIKKYKEEQTAKTLLNSALKDNKIALENILKIYSASEFIAEAKSNPSILKKFVQKNEAELLQKMIAEKKEKAKKAKKEFVLNSTNPSGLSEIKEILSIPKISIKYLGSSVFSAESDGKDFKDANHKVDSALIEIEKLAKEKKIHFELKKT